MKQANFFLKLHEVLRKIFKEKVNKTFPSDSKETWNQRKRQMFLDRNFNIIKERRVFKLADNFNVTQM